MSGHHWSAGDTRRPRRGRGVLSVVVSLLILAGLAVLADRLALAWATQQAERILADDFAADSSEVTIHGFPFLTQLASGNLSEADLSAGTLSFDGLVLADVSGTARGVPTSADGTIGKLEGSALVPTATLQELLERGLVEQGLGDLAPSVTISSSTGIVSLDADVRLTVLGLDLAPVTSGRAITFEVVAARFGDATIAPEDIPLGLGDELLAQIGDLSIDLDALPQGVELTGLTMNDDGALVQLSGENVAIPQQ